jgi:hypothetical protein
LLRHEHAGLVGLRSREVQPLDQRPPVALHGVSRLR